MSTVDALTSVHGRVRSLADAVRERFRTRDDLFLLLALVVGVLAGGLTLLQGWLAHPLTGAAATC